MKKIALLAMGGTISAKGLNRTDLKDYKSGLIAGDEYLKDLPELNNLAAIDVIQIDNVSSTEINVQHWLRLKREIDSFLNDKGYDGIVITHGTNTIEETAYFLHLTVNSDKPIVLVGSQRPYTALSTDAHLNLINAIRVAIHPGSYNKGVLVALNNEINSARDVTKTDTYQLNTFHSGGVGFLGFIEPDETIEYYRSPTRLHTVESKFSQLADGVKRLPSVEIVYSYAGATGEIINHITNCGKYAGIVVAGTGAGRFSKAEEIALMKAREKGLYIVRSSRVGNGRTVGIDPYKDLRAISGDNLTPQKARILLMLSLLKLEDVSDIQNIFDTH